MNKVGLNSEKILREDGYWYLASPYSKYPDGLEAAFKSVSAAAAYLIRRGAKVYSPIAHTHPVAIHGGIDPLDHNIWLPADAPFMHGACGLIICKMPSWEDSYGIGVEIDSFKLAGKPIHYMDWPT